MFRTHRYVPAFALLAGLLVAPACASGGYYGSSRPSSYREFERRAYDNGFAQGVRHGERDARDRRDFSYSRDRDYRDADAGYYRSGGSREEYRRVFRQGYQSGYAEGYNRVAGAYGRVGPSRGERYGYPGSSNNRGGYASGASQIGYRDGFEAGQTDARNRARYDPIRSRRYREGDHEYNSRYGARDEYKREYRAAFQQGYEQGYRRY